MTPANSSSGRVYDWELLDRHELTRLTPNATVVVPLGAIEQHGPYLPTGTDIILVSEEAPIPGHAGRWETSMMLATCPELVNERKQRAASDGRMTPGRGIYGARVWKAIDGYTDEPAQGSASEGAKIRQQIEEGLATRLIEVVAEMQ
jgi:creatinine amidohydrolase/Fe(II)-dependent formamide hydrolase-like protein